MSKILFLVLSACVLAAGELADDMQTYEKECLGEDIFMCLSGNCISHEQYCDGQPDCPDGSDEDFCAQDPDVLRCNQTHQYLCADAKRCIPHSWMCNNETDCEDGSDEQYCDFTTVLEEQQSNATCKGFQCDGGKCISHLWVCDGIVDCHDKTDEYIEENCRKYHYPRAVEDVTVCQEISTLTSYDRNYRCIDSSFCLLSSMMCNDIVDCRDGSDEGPFCDKWHSLCNGTNNPCNTNNSVCIPERYGPACLCLSSHIMREYNVTTEECDDVDECAIAQPQCSHGCINKDGHFSCTCDEGYTQDKFKYLCYANGPEALLFYTTSTEIKYIKIKSKEDVLLASGIKQVHGVSYDGKYLYWVQTAQGHQAIMRAELNNLQKTTQVIVSLGLEDPGDIAIDWLGGHIYFSDIQRGTISACATDGSVCVTVRTNCKKPRFVTLSVRYSKMFWADWHHRPLLMWANLDGSRSATLVDNLHGLPTGLALDEPNGRLYFVDRNIKVIKLDDKKVYSLFEDRFYHPYSVAVFENTVFWSDWISNSVQTADKLHGTGVKRNLLVGLSTPIYDMHMYHPVLMTPKFDACENLSCSHLCLASHSGRAVCACPDGMQVFRNRCEYLEDYHPLYLVIGGGSYFTRVEFNVLGNPEAHATMFDIGRVQAMAYDSRRDMLYLYDGQRKTLNYINMKEFSQGITKTFMFKGLTDIVDMAYEAATDTLYLLDAGRGFVEVVSMRTRKRALLWRLDSRHMGISMCLLPEYGRLLLVIMDTEHNNKIYVDSIGMDGEDHKTIISTNLRGPHVQVRYDRIDDKVYITDDGNGIIDVIHPQGTGRENFRQISTTLISMAMAESHMFWTDRRPRLYWTNMQQAAQNIRKLDFTMFPNHTQLYVQPTFRPLNYNDSLYDHPCLTAMPCSDVCVQRSHDLIPRSSSRNVSLTPYRCLCTPGLLNIDGKCTPLAECKDGQLYCHRSNLCVDEGKHCDGVRDCFHGEDEESCHVFESSTTEISRKCSAGQILCNGVCIIGSYCSAETTTSPGSTTTGNMCDSTEYLCPESSMCIERSRLCDGQTDCPLGHDEHADLCDTLTCHHTEFMCTSGSCILLDFKCDGEPDCPDDSDEENCEDVSCGISFYECRSKECIDLRKRCDGHQDCVDMSDEEDCDIRDKEMQVIEPQCEPEEYACEFNRSICLPPTARCNKKIDCPGGTDELGCDRRCAPHDMLECKQEYLCVKRNKICNGYPDCLDGSDETPEACRLVNMTSRLYRPSQFPATQCDDGYLCDNGQCVEWRDVCDGRTNCYDGSDESILCASSCANVSCPSSCRRSARGPQCACAAGTRPAPARAGPHACEDIDECARDPPPCAQHCKNTHGSFVCHCYEGYYLRSDGRTCKAANGDLSLVYSDENTVWSMSMDGHKHVVYNSPKLIGFADIGLDMRRQRLYVSVTPAGLLVEVNSTVKDDVHVSNIGKPAKLAVEWITGNVYFVDKTKGAACMRVCNIQRMRCARLQLLPDNAEVTALAIDPIADHLFYCVMRSGRGIVWSTSLAGFGLVDVTTVGNCTALAVDTAKQRLYVADADAKRIVSMDYGGEAQKIEVSNETNLEGIHGLAQFEEYIYFITSTSLNVHRCSLFGKRRCESVVHRPDGASAFILKHNSIQRSELDNPCPSLKCSNLCVFSIDGGVCVCDDGSLARDGVCPLFQKKELPLFNGLTSELYDNKQAAIYWVIGVGVLLIVFYVVALTYYKYTTRRNALNRHYLEVRFQNTTDESGQPTSSVVQMPTSSAGGHEFVNPAQFVKGIWDQIKGQKRPVGTEGLDIRVPELMCDTDADQSDRDDIQIIT